jgi:hypothetical protein
MIEQMYFDQLLSSINNINIKIDNIVNLLAALVNTITKYDNSYNEELLKTQGVVE